MPAPFLSPVRYTDADALVAAHRASRALHTPWAAPFVDHEGFDVWFGRQLTGAHVSLIARDREGGEIVGVVNLSEIVWGVFRSAYLGFYAIAGHERRGWMTAALRETARFAFAELGLHRLEANVQPANAASLALLRKLGFQREGVSPRYLRLDGAWRDHERWTLLADTIGGR